MKIHSQTIEQSGSLKYDEVRTMNIHKGAQALVLNHLIGAYSDPYLAALREYTSNAYDSHKVSGQTKPVEVSLPTPYNPALVIQDYGLGMSRDQLIEFSQFGASSKRDTDEEIGGFGIGSKCGLAISSQFTVDAVQDGKLNRVVIGRRADGQPTLSMFAEESTTEPNGVKIVIPSKPQSQFDYARDGFFVGWAKGSILVDGKEPKLSVSDSTLFEPMGDWGWMVDSGVSVGSYSSTVALVGPVKYELRWDKVAMSINNTLTSRFFPNVIIQLDNGSVDLTPSREELIYSDRTKDAIKSRVASILKEATKNFQDSIDRAPTPKEAMQIAVKATTSGFPGPYTYKGDPVAFRTYTKTDDGYVTASAIYGSGGDWTASHSGYRYSDLGIQIYTKYQSTSDKNSTRILITGASSHIYSRGYGSSSFLRHRDASKINHGLRALAEQDKVSPNSYRVYMIDGTEADLDQWVVSSMDRIIPIKDFNALTSAFRRSRLGKASAKPKSEVPTVRVAYYSFRHPSNGTAKPINELDKEGKYILLKEDGTLLMTQARSATVYSAGKERYTTTNQVLSELASEDGYTFLLANKNWDTSKYSDYINLTHLSDAVQARVDTYSTTLTSAETSARADLSGWRYSWARGFPENRLGEVNDEDTRQWLKAMLKPNAKVNTRIFNDLVRWAPSVAIKPPTLSAPSEDDIEDFSNKFSLIVRLDPPNGIDWTKLIAYINWIDSTKVD